MLKATTLNVEMLKAPYGFQHANPELTYLRHIGPTQGETDRDQYMAELLGSMS